MQYLFLITGALVLLSFWADRDKTVKALKITFKKFKKILPAFLAMLALVSIILFAVPDQVISHYLGSSNKFSGIILATFFGSITMMPGFIAFPLSGILLQKGVPYMVISAFTTTLMMVGVLTYPIEKEYFGHKVTLIRNGISLLIALIVALVIGIFFGEVL
ncbi:MAG: hypothetical protein PWQ96_923 [Clostridia bacterium]|jgi:uncharacterized membrane protein YraQ (UPF0718 family)|nr:hypothetical protein [Clostridiales bacterium]MDK2985281.1 hypothetical protein [Clostridia bacterium]